MSLSLLGLLRAGVCLLAALSLLHVVWRRSQPVPRLRYPARPSPLGVCGPQPAAPSSDSVRTVAANVLNVSTRPRVLIVSSQSAKSPISDLLDSFHLPYVVEQYSDHILVDLNGDPRFNLLIFAGVNVSRVQLEQLQAKCGRLGIGIISFVNGHVQIPTLSLVNPQTVSFDYVDEDVAFVARRNVRIPCADGSNAWRLRADGQPWKAVLQAEDEQGDREPVVVRQQTPCHHVVFGLALDSWISKVVFLDTLLFFFGERFLPGLRR